MRRGPSPVVLVVAGMLVAVLMASCNAILDNRPGHLAQTKGCKTGEKECLGGVCVSALDPSFGCGPGTCAACNLPRTSAYGCNGDGCAVSKCFVAYASCDNQNPNGCEADLRKPADCGACGSKCEAANKYCDSSDPAQNIHCVQVCPAGSVTCEQTLQCINPSIDIANCGGCGKECVPPPGGIPTCTNGLCGFACNASLGFRACPNGKCEQESIDSCGPSCQKCGVTDPNLFEPFCSNGACGQRCKAVDCNGRCQQQACQSTCASGKGDCDGDGTCETDLTSLPNCGACGEDCVPGPPNTTPRCIPGKPRDVCSYTCDPPFATCGASCVSLGANPNCGGCGRDCHASCNGGSCGTDCMGGWLNCDGIPNNGCEAPPGSACGLPDGGADGGDAGDAGDSGLPMPDGGDGGPIGDGGGPDSCPDGGGPVEAGDGASMGLFGCP